jgi:hypothetical protein
LKNNAIVKFKDEDHSYWRGKTQFISVNGLLGNFGFKFDEDYWLPRKALSDNIPNYWKLYFKKGFDFDKRKPELETLITAFEPEMNQLGTSIGELCALKKDEWIQSSVKGTAFHHEQENLAYELGYIENPFDGKKYNTKQKPNVPKGFDNISSLEFLKNMEDGAYTEVLVFSLLHLLAGQIDELFIETIDGVRYVDLGDHKTNKKKPKLTDKYGTCLYPIEHLGDCNYIKYQLQLSMYALLLEMLGFKVRNLAIYHYENYDVNTKNVITFKYLKKECQDILDVYLDHLQS